MSEAGMRQIEAIIKSEKFPSVDKALRDLGVSGVTMVEAKGRGRDEVITTSYVRGKWTFTTDVIHRVIVNVIVDASDVDRSCTQSSKARARRKSATGRYSSIR